MTDSGRERAARIGQAAERARAEAEARRRAGTAYRVDPAGLPAETGGPHGEEPVRYGDWEKGGRASDF